MMLTVVLEGRNFNTTTFFTTSIAQLYMLELQFSVIQHINHNIMHLQGAPMWKETPNPVFK